MDVIHLAARVAARVETAEYGEVAGLDVAVRTVGALVMVACIVNRKVGRAHLYTSTTAYASTRIVEHLGLATNCLGVVAPRSPQRTPFEKRRRPDARTVMN